MLHSNHGGYRSGFILVCNAESILQLVGRLEELTSGRLKHNVRKVYRLGCTVNRGASSSNFLRTVPVLSVRADL